MTYQHRNASKALPTTRLRALQCALTRTSPVWRSYITGWLGIGYTLILYGTACHQAGLAETESVDSLASLVDSFFEFTLHRLPHVTCHGHATCRASPV